MGTILVLLGPEGTPVLGSDDLNAYFAAFDYTPNDSGIFLMQVTFFESASTGEVVVTRK